VTPAAGVGWLPTVAAAARFEFLMQVRRVAVWAVQLGLIGLVLFTAGPDGPLQLRPGTPLPAVLATWALAVSMITPLGTGLLLADPIGYLPDDASRGEADVAALRAYLTPHWALP